MTTFTENTSSSSPSLELCIRISRAYAAQTRRLDNSLSNLHGLSFNDFLLLYHLQRAPGSRLRRIDLADKLGLTASGVTRCLLPLEKIGLVERQADPRDARVAYASLSEAGLALLLNAMSTAESASMDLMQTLPAEQIDLLSLQLGLLAGLSN